MIIWPKSKEDGKIGGQDDGGQGTLRQQVNDFEIYLMIKGHVPFQRALRVFNMTQNYTARASGIVARGPGPGPRARL